MKQIFDRIPNSEVRRNLGEVFISRAAQGFVDISIEMLATSGLLGSIHNSTRYIEGILPKDPICHA